MFLRGLLLVWGNNLLREMREYCTGIGLRVDLDVRRDRFCLLLNGFCLASEPRDNLRDDGFQGHGFTGCRIVAPEGPAKKEMTLTTMLIGYDLKRADGMDYAKLEEAIKGLGNWWHCLDSTWLVTTALTEAQVRDFLKNYIGTKDKLLVLTPSAPQAHGMASIKTAQII